MAWATRRRALAEQSLLWGLHAVAQTLRFLHNEARAVHGDVRAAAVFLGAGGEWKLGGLELLSAVADEEAVLFAHADLGPAAGRDRARVPPEVASGGWAAVRRGPVAAVDAWGLGILVSEVFAGGFAGAEQIGSVKNVPEKMHTAYRRLTHRVPKMRLSVGHFVEQGTRSGGFFDTPLIQLTDGIEKLGLKSETERETLLQWVAPVRLGDTNAELTMSTGNSRRSPTRATSPRSSSPSRSSPSSSSRWSSVAAARARSPSP